MKKLQSYGVTERGPVRSRNEDAFLTDEAVGLFAVADGIGGMQRGDEASERTLHLLQQKVNSAKNGNVQLVTFAEEISDSIYHLGKNADGTTGMGCTLTCLFLEGDFGQIAHVGDSAAYLFRGNGLTLLTRPHTMAQQLAGSRRMNDKRLLPEYFNHVLTRCVGQEGKLEVDFQSIILQPGDRFLLVTDGVTGVVPQEELVRILSSKRNPKSSVQSIQQAVIKHGAPDNMAIVVVDI